MSFPRFGEFIPKHTQQAGAFDTFPSRLLEPTADSADEEDIDFFVSLRAMGIGGLEIKRSANFVLLTNARDKAEELIKRVEQSANKKFRSLARDRSYHRVQSQLVKRLETPLFEDT